DQQRACRVWRARAHDVARHHVEELARTVRSRFPTGQFGCVYGGVRHRGAAPEARSLALGGARVKDARVMNVKVAGTLPRSRAAGGLIDTWLREKLVSAASRAPDYIALAKPRLNLLVVATSAAGYYLAGQLRPDLLPMAHAVIGTALV